MGSRIGSNTILLGLLLSAALPSCSTKPETANGAKEAGRQEKDLARQIANDEETAHIILQFRGCKAHQ